MAIKKLCLFQIFAVTANGTTIYFPKSSSLENFKLPLTHLPPIFNAYRHQLCFISFKASLHLFPSLHSLLSFDLSTHNLILPLSVLASQGPLILYTTFIVAVLFQNYKSSLLSISSILHPPA